MLSALRSVSPLVVAAAVLVAGTSCIASVAAAARNDAFLILSRSIETPNILENHNLTLLYSVFNVGGGEATDLALVDQSFPAQRFSLLEGSFSKKWPSLAPGASVTSSVVVDARRAGTFYTHPAVLSYKPVGGVETKTTSASDGTISVEDEYTFNKRTDMHVTDWIAFAVASALTVFGPYMAYVTSSRKLNLSDPVVIKKKQ
ncbi:hypothetical protein MMPV_007656 [Pyropia vietnamensis]